VSFNDSISGEPPEIQDANALLAQQESGYVAPDVETDQSAISQEVFTFLQGKVPQWVPHDGNLDTWLIEAFSEAGAEIRSLAADVPSSIFTTYGTLVLGVPPELALGASGTADFTAMDDLGYTLDLGTTFGLARSGNDIVAFQTLQEVTIAVGDTQALAVPFTAVETGADGNGLSGAGQMLDPVNWVTTITVADETSGGQDAELPDDYVDRLANLLPAVALRPILPQDFAVLALQLIPGVGRAIAMNLYDPATDTWNNARTVTLVVAQADGTPCTATVKAQVVAMLEALREVNWVVHVIDPHYTAINVNFDVVAFAGQDSTTVHDTCVANVTAYLQPGNYRLGELSPATAGGEVILPPTNGDDTRRQFIWVNELIALLDRSLGVDRVVAVTINGSAADFPLGGPYTLPTPGDITGTVEGANP
jgi:Baseplate J-like protein